MLLVNAQQQVVGWFDRVKDMGEKKEGDTVYKTKKDADAAGFGEQWVELRPKKEAGPRRAKVTSGAYTVVNAEKLKTTENTARSEALAMLSQCNTVESFLENCKGYSTEKNTVTAQSIMSYAIRRGIVELAA